MDPDFPSPLMTALCFYEKEKYSEYNLSLSLKRYILVNFVWRINLYSTVSPYLHIWALLTRGSPLRNHKNLNRHVNNEINLKILKTAPLCSPFHKTCMLEVNIYSNALILTSSIHSENKHQNLARNLLRIRFKVFFNLFR